MSEIEKIEMSEIEKIKRYIKATVVPKNVILRYGLGYEGYALINHSDANMILLAFEYGRAKGYRAAKAEVRKGGIA